jgi:nitroreductase
MNNMELFNNRRSVNNFDLQKELPMEKLKEIINLAVMAPSAFNLEPWRVIAVRDKEKKEALLKLAMNQPKVMEAPCTLIIIGDREGYGSHNPAWNELKEMAGEEATRGAISFAASLYGSTEERKIKFAKSNGALLAMSIMYAAKALGVDTHPMSGIDFEGIKREFNLLESEEVIMLIAMGYHDDAKSLFPRRNRRGFDKLVTVA